MTEKVYSQEQLQGWIDGFRSCADTAASYKVIFGVPEVDESAERWMRHLSDFLRGQADVIETNINKAPSVPYVHPVLEAQENLRILSGGAPSERAYHSDPWQAKMDRVPPIMDAKPRITAAATVAAYDVLNRYIVPAHYQTASPEEQRRIQMSVLRQALIAAKLADWGSAKGDINEHL